MDLWWIAGLAGLASGLSGVVARRAPLLAWVALTPLGIALSTCGWRAALTGALTGACLHGEAMISQPPSLRPLGVGFGAVGWALAAGLAGRVLESLPATALALVLPAVAVLAPLPMRVAGAPRWVHGALACTQEPWPVVIRTGWFGGELTVSGLLGATSAAACLLLPGPASAPLVALLALTIVGALLGLARRSLARTRRAIERLPRVRVAAVVVNGAPPEDAQPDGLWPSRSPEYRDVAAALARYAPRVREAAAAGAALVVLPEAAVVTDGEGARRFTEGARAWAAEHRVTVVAPYVDQSPRAACGITTSNIPCGGSSLRPAWSGHRAHGCSPPACGSRRSSVSIWTTPIWWPRCAAQAGSSSLRPTTGAEGSTRSTIAARCGRRSSREGRCFGRRATASARCATAPAECSHGPRASTGPRCWWWTHRSGDAHSPGVTRAGHGRSSASASTSGSSEVDRRERGGTPGTWLS
jgi:hypothetical protein